MRYSKPIQNFYNPMLCVFAIRFAVMVELYGTCHNINSCHKKARNLRFKAYLSIYLSKCLVLPDHMDNNRWHYQTLAIPDTIER